MFFTQKLNSPIILKYIDGAPDGTSQDAGFKNRIGLQRFYGMWEMF